MPYGTYQYFNQNFQFFEFIFQLFEKVSLFIRKYAFNNQVGM